MVEQAPRIYSFGASISSILSNLIRYIFNQVQKEAHCLDEGNMTPEERIVALKKDDLVIFCSFYPYSRCTIEFAQLANEQGLQVVAISDNEYSPISEYASLVLAIPRENVLFTTSIAAFSVLINAIATEIAYKKKDLLTESINNTDKILKKFYYLS
jgi:DNA-binding MurR/RpiR family transcriptional regulator